MKKPTTTLRSKRTQDLHKTTSVNVFISIKYEQQFLDKIQCLAHRIVARFSFHLFFCAFNSFAPGAHTPQPSAYFIVNSGVLAHFESAHSAQFNQLCLRSAKTKICTKDSTIQRNQLKKAFKLMPRPHRARCSTAQRENGKFSCVNTLLGNSCFHFGTASRRRNVTPTSLSGRGVSGDHCSTQFHFQC